MTLLHRLASMLHWILGRDKAEHDLDDEMRAFVEMAAADKLRAGMSAVEARRMAILDLGGVEQTKERVRADRHGAWLDHVARDVRYALRTCARNPAFSVVVVITLALGIGMTTAVFTVVNGVLLRPLPYRDPDRLVMLYYGHKGNVSPWFSPPNVRDYVGPSDAFAEASSVAPVTVNMTGAGDPERVQGARVSWNFFRLLGVSTPLGRAFTEGDGQGDGNQVVLSDGLWRRRFGGRLDVVNSTTTLDGHTVTIIGVAPASLKFPAAAEFWLPLMFTPRDLAPAARGAQWVHELARLRDTVSAAEATTALQTVADPLATEFP